MIARFIVIALLLALPLSATQYGLPDANSGSSSFTECAGDGDGDWWDELDEGFGAGRGSGSGPDDATTQWKSPVNPSSEVIDVTVGDVTDPAVSTGHVVRSRQRKITYDGTCGGTGTGKQIDSIVTLLQSSTTIASVTQVHLGGSFATSTLTLSSGEADSITDYTALIVRFTAHAVGGGTPRRGAVSALELEVPGGSRRRSLVLLTGE